jgi:undecaprenyl diphosphate synthase
MDDKIPRHVVIIPDGNRRWAREKGLKATLGHVKAGAYENLSVLFRTAKELGVKYISLWGFSTENWKRDKKEVDEIMNVIDKGVDNCLKNAEKDRVGFLHIGRKDRISKQLKEKLEKLEKATEKFKENFALLCIDYGGRDEIARAVNKILKGGKKKIDAEGFVNYLDTARIPDPELIIRTGGEKRLSGFMPFQSDYAELYFTDIYFPDFDAEELKKAVLWFGERKRRFGR